MQTRRSRIFVMTMYAEAEYPSSLLPEQLDQYLAKGWFRMGQSIFTTNFLTFHDQLYSAIWLRIALKHLQPDKTQHKLRKQNSAFLVTIREASLTTEKEELYANYRQSVAFNGSPSLHHLLYGESTHTIFNTMEVVVHDRDKLIAAGFFDTGKNSAAGISSFYDPAYKKYSLGKYLIYLKMEYCKNLGMEYFYPGYFVPGYSFFDYKLKIGTSALEYLDLNIQQWLPIGKFSRSPLEIIREKLHTLQGLLSRCNVESTVTDYEYYSANLVPDLRGMSFLDAPVFLFVTDVIDGILHPLVVYNICDGYYHLLQCRSVWSQDAHTQLNTLYASHLLQVEEDLFTTPDAQQMLSRLLPELQYRWKRFS